MNEKYIIDDVKYEVKPEEQKNFISEMKKTKKFLEENGLLPDIYQLYKDIDKEKNIFKLYLGFKSDKDYDIWEKKVQKFPELLKEALDRSEKYFKGYNYSEKIEL